MSLPRNVLRQILKDARQRFVLERQSSNISERLSVLTRAYERAQCVAGYRAMNGEVVIDNLIDLAAAHGSTTALPHLADDATLMVFRAWSPGELLERATWGFEQPLASAEAVTPDLILTPLVGFDRALNRLGYGKGHYDRAFAGNPAALRIGIAWSVQEVEALEPEAWDMPLDAVLTEKEWITAAHSRLGEPQ